MAKAFASFSILIVAIIFSMSFQAAAAAQTAEPNFVSMDPNTVMAKYGQQKLTLEDVRYIIGSVTPESARQFAQQWVDLQMMYEAAKQRGLTDEPKTKLLSELGSKSLYARELMNSVAAEVNIPDANIREFYEKNKNTDSQLFEPNRLSFAHVRTKTAEEANSVKKRIEAGEALEMLAKELSIAPDAKKGGTVKKLPEPIVNQQYGQDFLDAFNGASEGEVFGPVKMKDGYEIARHEGMLIRKVYPYDMVKGIIRQRLESTLKTDTQQKFVDELKKREQPKVYFSPLIESPKPSRQEGKSAEQQNLPVDKSKNKSDNSAQKK